MKRKLLFLLVFAMAAHARTIVDTETEFRFRGAVPAGRSIEIKGVNGNVIAEPSTSGEVEVVALKRGEGAGHPVRVSVVEHDGGATIQTLQPAATVAEVDYRVRVPAGVRFVGRTANGKVEAHGLESPVDAETVNGNIDIETSSSLQARAVNGSITARLSPASDAPPSTLETVNGSVTLALPDRSPASIEATTLYGSINSRGPSFRRDLQRRRNGAPHVHLRTISGNINIFRAASRP